MEQLQKLKKRFFNWATRSIFDTPPITCDPASNLVVLSQSYHADLTMYLIAAKSFGRFVRPKMFVVVDDGLTPDDQALLRRHLDQVRFIRTAEVDVGRCPRRGCWERLISISRLSQQHYVIQLDSDTVTVDRPDEVLDCVARNRSFTLGTTQGSQVVSVAQASDFVKEIDDSHVQLQAEKVLARLPGADALRYVRGCAGFAGFGRGQLAFEPLEAFSEAMAGAIGRQAWSSWGSEQVASNFMVANTPDPMILPLDKYLNYVPARNIGAARLLHFIGDHRFRGTTYVMQSRRAIASAGA